MQQWNCGGADIQIIGTSSFVCFLCVTPNLSSQVRLIDAGFLWTEPHSKRIKMKVTIQKEVRKQELWEIHMCTDAGGKMPRNGYPLLYIMSSKALVNRTIFSSHCCCLSWILDNGVSAGVERRHLTAGVCGGVCSPIPDVWRLSSRGSQRLLESCGSSQTEGGNTGFKTIWAPCSLVLLSWTLLTRTN